MPRRALWTSIHDTLLKEIGAGHYQAGDKLPTEADLAARFDVNRHTIRRALAALADAGHVRARRGAGVFVTHQQTDYPIGKRVRFSQSVLALGRQPGRVPLLRETRGCDAKEANALHLSVGDPVHVAEGLTLADGDVLGLTRGVFPAARFPRLLDNLDALDSITAAFKAEGVDDYVRASTRIDAKLASATLAHHLGVPEGAPILRTINLNADLEGQPIEYGRTWFAADRVTLTLAGDALG